MCRHPATQGGKWIWPATRWAIYFRDGFACVYCEIISTSLTLDHLLAVDKGGSNDPSNLVTCCLSCNSSKQGLSIRKWYAKLRKRGRDTNAIKNRIRRLTNKPLDREVGHFLVKTRKNDDTSQEAAA